MEIHLRRSVQLSDHVSIDLSSSALTDREEITSTCWLDKDYSAVSDIASGTFVSNCIGPLARLSLLDAQVDNRAEVRLQGLATLHNALSDHQRQLEVVLATLRYAKAASLSHLLSAVLPVSPPFSSRNKGQISRGGLFCHGSV